MSWSTAAFYGLNALGSALNARTSARNTVAQSRFALDNARQNIVFNQGQRQEAMAWSNQSLAEQLALERRNLETQIRIADANRQAQLATALANIQAEEQAMARQAGLVKDESERQQAYARGQRDVVDANTDLFGNFEGQLDNQSGGIAEAIMEFVNANRPDAQGPAASGATAAREAALRASASGDVAGDVQRGADVNALSELMGNIGVTTGRNNQLGDLLANFARGSASTLDPALDAAKMWVRQAPITQDIVPQERYISPGEFRPQRYISDPAPIAGNSYLGDLLKLGAGLGARGAFNGMFRPSPYSLLRDGESFNNFGLQAPEAPNLDFMGGGQGVRLAGGNTGLVLRSNLGIR